jgi:hypothetical protein
MNPFKWAAGILLASLLAVGARAQEDRPAGPPDEGGPSPELNLEVVEQFDANSDGELNGDELGRARRFLRALRGLVGDRDDRPRGEGRRDRPRADRPDDADPAGPPYEGVEGDRPRGDRGLRRGDRRRPRAEGAGPPDDGPRSRRDEPRRLFREFDADENGQLNPEEFAALMGSVDERRGPRGPGAGPDGPPEGPRVGPGGPPEGRPFRRRGPPDGEGGPEFRGPDGPPPGADYGDREEPRGRRFRPRDGERGRRPPQPDGGDAPAWEGDEPVGDEPDAAA